MEKEQPTTPVQPTNPDLTETADATETAEAPESASETVATAATDSTDATDATEAIDATDSSTPSRGDSANGMATQVSLKTAVAAAVALGWTLLALMLGTGLMALIALTRSGIRHFWASHGRATPPLRVLEGAPIALLLGGCVALTLQAGPDVLRFVPALNIGDEDVAEGLARLRAALADVVRS
mgnify:CR=1 FL=1